MTVSSIIPVNNYVGNSSNKEFDFDFLIEDESELVVQRTDTDGVITTLTLGVDYSINEVGNEEGSYITFPLDSSSYSVLAEDEKICLMLSLVIKQESEFENSSYFNFSILEWTFDYIVRILQIMSRQIERAAKVAEGSDTDTDELVYNINTLADSLSVIESVNNNSTNINAVVANEENINLVCANEGNINIVANDIKNIVIAAENITDINTISENITDINTCAENIEDIQNAYSNAQTAIDKAEEASNYADNAKIWAEGTDVEVAALGGEHSAKIWAEQATDGADIGLTNLSDVGINKLEAQKGYYTGNVLTDSKEYNQLIEMKHSTFDASLVTVAGSPSITTDGIASNFSLSDYVLVEAPEISSTESFYFRCKSYCVNNDTDDRYQTLISAPNVETNSSYITKFAVNRYGTDIVVQIYDADANLLYNTASDSRSNFSSDCEHEFIVDYKNGTLNIYADDTLLYTKEVDLSTTYWGTAFLIGNNIRNAQIQYGTIDLKSCELRINGTTYVSYNQTGTDVIKEDDYTLIGSPDVSEDGILSNCSVGNVLQTPVTLSDLAGNSWSIKGSAVLGDESACLVKLSSYPNNAYIAFGSVRWIAASKLLNFYARTGTSDDDNNEGQHISSSSFEVGDTVYYQLNFDYDSGTYSLYADTTDGTTFIGSWTSDTSTAELYYISTNPEYYITLGCGSDSVSYLTTGSIDLNNFLVYINGDLFYQPCLKIPYTLSSTGSKIVDAVYRSRVQNLYEQEGKALYYTLDEDNNNFTLPMGEIYGMMKSYVDENTSALQENLNTLQSTVETDYLPLSGGTMTGIIKMDVQSAGTDSIQFYNGNFMADTTETPSSTISNGAIVFKDSDFWDTGSVYNELDSSSNMVTGLNVTRNIDDKTYVSYLNAYVDSEGVACGRCPTYPVYTDSSTAICTTAFLKNVLSGSGYGLMTYSKANNLGYMKFANGLIIQWGTSSGTITFATAMSNSSYCFLDGILSTSSGNQSGGWTSKSTTGVVTTYGSAGGLNWMVIGY